MDLKAFLLRLTLALFVPNAVYTLCWTIGLFPDTVNYWNIYYWGAILIVALLKPTSQLTLFMFFKPIEMIVKAKIKWPYPNKRSFSQRGNFIPVQRELSYELT